MSRSRRDPIIGYRWWWAFRHGDGTVGLRAWVWDLEWRVPGITTALHWDESSNMVRGGFLHVRQIPAKDCSCGIYAWFRLPSALTEIKRFNRREGNMNGMVAVAGAVVTGGMTIQHGDEGMRVHTARPVAFSQPDPPITPDEKGIVTDTHLIPELASAFGVPLIPIDKLETYAREFGITIMEAA